MTSKTVAVILTGENASLIAAMDGGAATATKTAAVMESKLGGSASKVGLAFNALAAQAGSFGVPFAAAAGRVGTTLEQVEGKTSSFGSTLAKIGGIEAAAAVVGLIAVGTEAVHLADALETAHAREITSISNAGQAYGDYAGKISATEQQMEKFGFTNADTESSIARLVASTHDTGAALQLEGVAADTARFKNVDLATATNLVAQVEAGRYKGLIALGIATTEQVKGFKSSQDAIDLLTNATKGSASAAADTFAGKMKTLSATAQDLGAKLGEAIIPGIEKMATAASDGVTGLENLNRSLDGVPGKLAAIAVAAPIAAAAIEKLRLIAGGSSVFASVAAPVAAAAPVVLGAAVVAGGGIEAVRAGASALQKDVGSSSQGVKDLAAGLDLLGHNGGASLSSLGINVDNLSKMMKENKTETSGWAGQFEDGSLKMLGISSRAKDTIVEEKNALELLYKTDPTAAVTAFGRMAAALIASGVSSQTIGSNFHDFIQLMGDAPPKVDAVTSSVFDLSAAFADLTSKTGALAQADAGFSIGDKFDAISTAAQKVAADKADLAGTSQNATDADKAERDAVRGLADANRGVTDSHQKLTDSYATL